ncbi:MAG TPA: hypothetical protein ENJ52_09370 [Aliiroseovarius sp.]|nr:hypothetical protein [Aliiroseovarius sp.]
MGSVFLCLVAALTSVYLAMVLPSFDALFPAGAPDGPDIAAVAPRIAPPSRPESSSAVAPIVAAPMAAVPVAIPARPNLSGEEPAPIVAASAVGATAPIATRPVPRPESIVTVAATMTAPERDQQADDPLQAALLALAAPASPRPAARPASLVTLSPRAPTQALAETAPAQLASLASPGGQVYGNGGNFSGACSARLARAIPRRPGRARTGSAFVAALTNTAGGSRDAAIVREALAGNVPDFLRRLVPVKLAGTLADGRQAEITICVTPDYLALGSNRDYVRVPLGLHAAGQVADAFNMMLPTTRMVDAIYAQAAVHLSPKPMPAGGQMVTTTYFLRHNQTVQGQLAAARAPLGALVAGQKKDLVLTNRLASNPGRVAIYGWHRGNGRPIQPLTTVHGASYADYSHGIRLVARTAYLNGRPVDLRTLLQDRRYARLLSTEGPVGASAIRIASR